MSDSGAVHVALPVHLRRALGVVVAALLVWIVAVVLARIQGGNIAPNLLAFGRDAAAEAFAAATLVQLVCWRTSGATGALRLAVTLGTVAIALPLLNTLAPVTTDGRTVSAPAEAGRVALYGAAAWVVFRIGYAPARRGTPASGWTFLAIATTACGECVRLLTSLDPRSLLGVAPGFEVAAGVLMTAAGAVELHALWQRQRRLSATLSRELEHAQTVQRERLHDARSTVAGVIGASALLADAGAAPSADLARLQRLIAAELARLQHVLDTDGTEPVREFDVADAIEPVLLAHHVDRADLPPLRACGRPHATATALANVLRNARVHAPGAAVAVAVRRRVDRVEIVVDDAGAGIPAARRSVVLLPDVRDAAPGVPGQGLGLASAAAAMSAQSGALTLADSPTGGLRVTLTLPAAPAAVDAVAC